MYPFLNSLITYKNEHRCVQCNYPVLLPSVCPCCLVKNGKDSGKKSLRNVVSKVRKGKQFSVVINEEGKMRLDTLDSGLRIYVECQVGDCIDPEEVLFLWDGKELTELDNKWYHEV